MLNIGNTIGPYTIIQRLGSGGFSDSYLAEQRRGIVRSQVVLQVIRSEQDNVPLDWHKAAKAWEQVGRHPNIVSLLEADYFDGHLVFVLEYFPGGSLRDWLRRHEKGIPTLEAAADMMSKVLLGLNHVHQQGIIHRDIKPENILLDGETPRITDFLLALTIEEANNYGGDIIVGTPSYMAPEAFLGGPFSVGLDIWSAGVVLYELVAGSQPFEVELDTWRHPHKILHDDPMPLPSSVPKLLEQVIMHALEKQVVQRYQTAADMRAALLKAKAQIGSPTVGEGTLLNNRYRVLQILSESGGFGDTFLAEDTHLPSKRRTVIKRLKYHSDNADMQKLIQDRFEREAVILEKLAESSNQIPKLYAYFVEQGQFYLVQELIEGQTLSAKMRAEGPLSEPTVKELLKSLLSVLVYVHSHDIIHRDIKPDNIILRHRDGKPILIDFGAVKEKIKEVVDQASPNSPSIIIGSPGFMPPEQTAGFPLYSSDLYSLGWTAICLLTGKMPHEIDTNRVTGEKAWRSHASEISANFASVLEKATQLIWQDRYTTAQEMLNDLNRSETFTSEARESIRSESRDTTPVAGKRPDHKYGNRYQIVRPISLGDLGESYQARDIRTGELVCLHLLSSSSNESFLAQICGALVRLKHKNITRVVDFDLKPLSAFLATEFISGPTLSEYLRVHQPLALPVAVAITGQLFHAVAYSHRQSVIHSNLNPSRILMRFTGNDLVPKILGFGSAILNQLAVINDKADLESQERLIQYRAPEQIDGITPTESCDVYSLGQVLWEMIVGRPAFQGDLMTVIREKTGLSDGLEIPEQIPNVPESLSSLIKECTRRDPVKRPKAHDVAGVLDNLGPEITPPAVLAPFNLGFDMLNAGGLLPGWFNSLGYVDNVSTSYELELIAREDKSSGSCVQMWSDQAGVDDFGSLMQRCPGWHLANKRVRFEGEIGTNQVSQWGGLWIRADGGGRALYFYNMHDRPIVGSTPWTKYRIEAKVPAGTEWINYGILLVGPGQIWADNLQLLVEAYDGTWRRLSLWDETEYSIP